VIGRIFERKSILSDREQEFRVREQVLLESLGGAVERFESILVARVPGVHLSQQGVEMMRLDRLWFLILLVTAGGMFVSSPGAAQATLRDAPTTALAVTGARLIDGTGAGPVTGVTILIQNGRFADIGPDGQVQVPDGGRVIQADGRTVVPGLIDAHFHMNYPTTPAGTPFVLHPALSAYRSIPVLERHVMGGITTILDAGGYRDVTIMAKEAYRQGWITSPRPIVVGERINGTGGHGVSRFDMAVEVDGANGFRRAVRQQIHAGADLIKILPPYSREELQAAIEETHLLQRRVAVHSGYLRQLAYIRWAEELDADIIMHAYALPDDVIRMMGEKGIWAVPTMSIMMKNQLGPRYRVDNPEPHQYEIIFQKLLEAGVRMAIGTDALYEYMLDNPGLYFDEVERFVKNGCSAMEAIVSATRHGAEALGYGATLGTVERGKLADLLIIDGDPLADIRNLRSVLTVIQEGRVIRSDLPLGLVPPPPAGG